MDQIL
jgi:hypothetical protein